MHVRFRYSTKQMLTFIALAAVAFLLARVLRDGWLREHYRSPVSRSVLSAICGNGELIHPFVVGTPVPVTITYDFQFDTLRQKKGSTVKLVASVWFEDAQTHRYVEGYTFDAPLTIGGRERAPGKFVWEGMLPQPGRYALRTLLWHITESGEAQFAGWNSCTFREYDFVASSAPGTTR